MTDTEVTPTMNDYPFVPLTSYREYPIEAMRERLTEFFAGKARADLVFDPLGLLKQVEAFLGEVVENDDFGHGRVQG